MVCQYLIQHCNLPVNEKDIFGQTPIYYACREGRLDVVKLLIDSGSNINLDDNYGQTCLFYAVKHNHFDVVQYLVEKGINVNKIDKNIFDCQFLSKSNPGQLIKIRVMLFNLYA